jgi:hypothetical protein
MKIKPKEKDKKYEKPKIKKIRKMTFPVEIVLADGRQVVCRQCSSCHSCRSCR